MFTHDLQDAIENHIDQAIFDAEQEFAEIGNSIEANKAFLELDKSINDMEKGV